MSTASLFFPVLGVILSNALYFSPLPAVRAASRTGHLGQLNVLPQALMVVSTQAWMAYALAVPNPFIVASNLPGAIAALAFVTTTLPLIPRESADERHTVQAVLVLGATLMLLIWSYLVFSAVDHDQRCFILGAYGSVICVILFASPLSTVREVFATANSASIYAPLTAAQCANCLMWTVYGLAIGDVWVYGPNGTGLALGSVQLILKLLYPSHALPKHYSGPEAARLRAGKDSCSDEARSDDDNYS